MRFTFDAAKSEKNIAERGLSFALAAELNWEAALIVEDTVVVTPRTDELRVISFRKVNRKAEELYEQHSKI